MLNAKRRRRAASSDTGALASTRRRACEGGRSGARLLAMASAFLLPSALIFSVASAPSAAAFVLSPATSPFCGCNSAQVGGEIGKVS